MVLCKICSRLDFSREYTNVKQELGFYDELLEKSRRLGPDQGGCDGCAFFCTVLQDWHQHSTGPKGCLTVSCMEFEKTDICFTNSSSSEEVVTVGLYLHDYTEVPYKGMPLRVRGRFKSLPS